MPDLVSLFASFDPTDPRILPYLIGLGVFVIVIGARQAFFDGPTQEQRRIRAVAQARPAASVVRLEDNDPDGVLRLFVPRSEKERTDIAHKVRMAGIFKPNAVRVFYGLRMALSLALPFVFLGLVWFGPRLPGAIGSATVPLVSLPPIWIFQIAVGLIVVGFYGPMIWLNGRIAERQQAITRGMPNALDLMRIAVEAGLGFDSAVTRVAHELAVACPPIAQEFTILELEVQAGKPRERALIDLARRTGVEEMTTFSTVINQSAEFGTPIGDALTTCSEELRFTREMRAQEQANKLPVKMSGVIAGIMMPVLLMMLLTPIAIRWVRMWDGA